MSASPSSPRATVALDLGAVLALFAIVCGPYLVRVYASALPGGWDGVPHYAIADLYARRLFPAIDGWLDEYFAGMPYPTFYPPIFYMAVALLTRLSLSTLSTKAAFWAVQTAGSAAVPCLTYLCARRLATGTAASTPNSSGRVAGLCAAAITVGLMVDHNALFRQGITLHSTFDAGLSTQLLGHVFLLAFYVALLGADASRGSAALAAVFLALVPLTNVHMVWAAAFLFVPLAAVRAIAPGSRADRLRVLARHGVIGLAAVLLSACWVVPMIARIRFVPTQALEPPGPGVVAFAFLRFGGYVVFAAVAALARRDRRALALVSSLVLLLAFTVLPSARYLALGDLAIQPARVVIPFPFLAAILIGYLVSASRDVFRSAAAQPIAGLACAVAFFVHFHLDTQPVGNVSAAQLAGYEQVLRAIDGRTDGRVLVEMGGAEGVSDTFALQALAGMRGARSLTTVFRESALDVLFAVPLRNSFSAAPEVFGVDHKITGAELAAGPVEQQLSRLRLFDVRYFVVRSEQAKARVAALPGARRIEAGAAWEVWTLPDERPGYAAVPAFAPVLTFARFSVKPRPDDDVDFVRLGEEMFAGGRLDVPLALAREPRLDRSDDWDRFSTVLITDYRYDSIDRAFEAVERASRDRTIVLWPSVDPLYARLVDLAKTRPTVKLVTAPPAEADRRAAGREKSRRILDAIDAVKAPLAGAPAVASARLEGARASITLDRDPERPTPVWIRRGYFPSWASEGGEPVYMATPTFQLTFAHRRAVELRFERGPVEWTARLLGAIGLALVAALLRRRTWSLRGGSGEPAAARGGCDQVPERSQDPDPHAHRPQHRRAEVL